MGLLFQLKNVFSIPDYYFHQVEISTYELINQLKHQFIAPVRARLIIVTYFAMQAIFIFRFYKKKVSCSE